MSIAPICPTCGMISDTKPRSPDQHARYFGTIRALFGHWPEYHIHTGEIIEFRPQSENQLRKYLQIRAGYITEKIVMLTSRDKKVQYHTRMAIEAVLAGADTYAEVEPRPNGVLIRESQSISYRALGHKKFCLLYNDVKEVVYALTGLDAETVLQEQKRAA